MVPAKYKLFGRFCLNAGRHWHVSTNYSKLQILCHLSVTVFKDVVTPVHIPLHKFYTCSSPHVDIQMFKTRMFSAPRQKYFQIFWKFIHAWTLFVLSMCFARVYRRKNLLSNFLLEIFWLEICVWLFANCLIRKTFRKNYSFYLAQKKPLHRLQT